MTDESRQRSVFFRHQALVTLHLAPTPKYPAMAIAKVLKLTAEREYVLVQDAADPFSLHESIGEGRLKGLNVMFISPMRG